LIHNSRKKCKGKSKKYKVKSARQKWKIENSCAGRIENWQHHAPPGILSVFQ